MKGQELGETIYLTGHAHIDLSWLWTKGETIHKICPVTFSSVLNLMKKYPILKFCQSSAQIYEWMERYYPEIFEEIKRNVKDGRWEIVGGSWTEHNATIPCGESLIRQYLFGKRYFMKKFGIDVEIAWLPDTFGFCWSLPQILKKCGISFFLTYKLKWQIERMRPPIPFPHYLFWWQSLDGSKILAYHTVGSYNERLDRKYADLIMLAQLEELKKTHGINRLLVLFGHGDHGGGPTEDMMREALKLKEREGYPLIRFSTAKQYFEEILSTIDGKKIPTVNDELYVKTHRGTLTTEAMMKRENRRCEVLLLSAEKFLYIAKRYGFTYPKEGLRRCWKRLLFNQVHDNLDGTSIEAVYLDAATDYKEIRRFISKINHLEAIAKHICTSNRGAKALVVFNSLSWRRKSIVKVPMKEMPEETFCILDQNDVEIPYQIVNEGEEKLIFEADVPAFGYRVYHIMPSEEEKTSFKTDLKVKENRIENTDLEVQVRPELNYTVTVFDKKNRRMVFDPSRGGNILEIYEDKPPDAPDGEPAWNIYLGNRSEPEALKAYIVEDGPVRAKIRIERRFGNSKFIQDVILYAYAQQVDFEIHIDWHENYRFAKICFPLNLSSYWATYEIPYGVIQRYDHSLKEAPPENMELPPRRWGIADTAKWEVSAQKWVDVSSLSSDYGVSLLNDSKYGFSFEQNTLRMSILRGPRRGYRFTPESWADQSEEPRIGIHHIRYAIYPHRGDWRSAGTVRKGFEFNYPLQVVLEDPHDGELPSQHSFIEVSPENVILTVAKEAEDSEDMILRLYEAHGSDTEARIKFDRAPNRVLQTDLMEWDKYLPSVEYEIKGNAIFVPMKPWEIKTLKVQYLSRGDQDFD